MNAATEFAIGQQVRLRQHPGRWGTVVLVALYEELPYFVDVHPGAVNHYVYMRHPWGYGEGKDVALNRFSADQLEAIERAPADREQMEQRREVLIRELAAGACQGVCGDERERRQ